MPRPRAHIHKHRRDRPGFGVLSDDLYIQIAPCPRLGRPPKRDPETWRGYHIQSSKHGWPANMLPVVFEDRAIVAVGD
jgi:hypothetical protein